MDNLIGKKLDGRYQLEELIGSGGMANVYKATDLLENRLVAVKILREECRGNEDLVRRFKNESKAMSVLDHPIRCQRDGQAPIYRDGVYRRHHAERIYGVPRPAFDV